MMVNFREMTLAEGGLYDIEERSTFAKVVNLLLKDDESCKDSIPINSEDHSLFHAFGKGDLLCKLLQQIDPTIIDDRAELACDVAETTVALRSDSITNY